MARRYLGISSSGTTDLPDRQYVDSADAIVLSTAGTNAATAITTERTTGATIQNKTLDNTNTLTPKDLFLTIQSWSDATKGIQFSAANITPGTTRVITVPDASLTLVGDTLAQTLTNKTLTNPILTLPTIGTTGLKINGSTSGTSTVVAPAVAGATTIILPSSSQTLATLAQAETLTNKTLTAPTLSGTVAGTYTLGGTPTFPAAVAQLTTAQTLTNKAITPRIGTVTTSATITITVTSTDQYNITALAVAATISTTGTPVDGQKLLIRIKDSGTAQTLTWGTIFMSSGSATLLSTTVAGKTHLSGFIYDSAAAKFVLQAVDTAGY